jgi:hypothetical protein
MKTFIGNTGHFCLTVFFCLTLSACNQEDFYEKEYLENPFQDPTTTGSVNGGGNGGVNSGTKGGIHGGVNSGVSGGTSGGSTNGPSQGGVNGGTTSGTGSTQGGTDGSGTSGTTGGTAGGTSGQSSGGTTGGTTGDTAGNTTGTTSGGVSGGGTTGSTTGGSTGSTTGGSTGSTTGGSTGSTTGGSTGSTTGGTTGSTTGGTGGCSNNGHGNNDDGVDSSNPSNGSGGPNGSGDPSGNVDDEKNGCSKSVVENFQQAADETKKLDIMWIIDNSGSMRDEQEALGRNFDAFIREFINRNVDFKMAITTTDTRSQYKGVMVHGSEEKLNSRAAQQNPTKFIADFNQMVRVGTSGSGNEKGLEASEGFMQRYSKTFLREDAYLAVVILSDEEDQSPHSPIYYADYLKQHKREGGLVKVYSIVDVNLTNKGSSGITTGYARYAEVSKKTAGTVADIREDFYRVLSEMGESIINLLDSFALAHQPIDGTLRVYVNDILVTNYTYDKTSSSIKFDRNDLPPVGAKIKVTYMK